MLYEELNAKRKDGKMRLQIDQEFLQNEILYTIRNTMNNTKSEKYQTGLKMIEKDGLRSDVFRMKFDFHRSTKVKKEAYRKFRHAEKIDKKKKIRLTKILEINDRVLILAKKIKKKDACGKFCKSTPQNKSFFNKD